MFKWFWTVLSLGAPEHWIYQIRTEIRLRIPKSEVLLIGFLIQAYRTWAIKPDMKKTPSATYGVDLQFVNKKYKQNLSKYPDVQ